MMRSTYFGRVSDMYARQNFKEFYSRIFSGKISPFIAAAFSFTRVTPNQLTLAMIPSGFIGAILFSMGNNWCYLYGGLFFMLLNILDAADGELARYTGKTSLFGDYLDRVAHYATNSAAVLGMGIGLYLQTGYLIALFAMVILEISLILDEVIRDLLITCGIEKLNEDGSDRKNKKAGTKLSIASFPVLAGTILFSNIAFFHLVPFLVLIDMNVKWNSNLSILFIYYIVFALSSFVKLVLRCRIISRSY